MAPLYKRYTPAKPATSTNATDIPRPDPATPSPEKKRKRERTQEEIAERKAKKLKKKGIDPETVAGVDTSSDAVISGHKIKLEEVEHHDGGNNEQPPGEFAHVASAKKRHKLEKEARKARKAAKKDNFTTEESLGEAPILPENEGSGEGALAISSVDTEVKDIDVGTIASVNSSGNGERVKEKPKKRWKDVEREEQTTGGDIQDDDDEHLRKHNAVLDKFQKSANRAIRHQQEESFESLPEQPVVRHLELPPVERTPTPEFMSENAALPSWLAKPTVVTTEKKATFRDLDIEAGSADRLSKLGFGDALPVQQALIPILMPPGTPGATYPPGTEDVLPDVAVSAPTGSGKTIAYLLPLIEALRHQSQSGKLSALIIVPTRELVMQVAAVAESLVKGSPIKGSPIKVGMATGTGKFEDEQSKIITRGARFDPMGYKKLVGSAKSQVYPPDEDSDEFPAYLEQMGQEDMKRQQWIQDTVSGLVNHVPTYSSAVDILVATPGRLLEHINSTLGFNLVHLQWLVIDEADKLLDNQYEGFLQSLNAELERKRLEEEQDPREKYLRSQALWDERTERRLRKVILSATMTRDISKLTTLNLRRPKMIVVRGAESNDVQADGENREAMGESSVKQSVDGFELPRTIVEYCIPVGDGSEKPLVAVELLKSKVLGEKHAEVDKESKAAQGDEESDSDSDSDSDDTSITSSDDSDFSTSDADSEEGSKVDDDSSQHRQDSTVLDCPPASDIRPNPPAAPRAPTILMFTSSNESANRLSHLLQGLKPEWKSWITTLIKAKPGKARIRSKADEPAIVISTDRAARGLDSFSNRPITHVIQYDVPRTLTSYVHRVGRTARAGRDGDAWTLYTHAEARWFVNEVTKAKEITRRVPVERVKVSMADDGMRSRYQQVLAGMRDEVFGATS